MLRGVDNCRNGLPSTPPLGLGVSFSPLVLPSEISRRHPPHGLVPVTARTPFSIRHIRTAPLLFSAGAVCSTHRALYRRRGNLLWWIYPPRDGRAVDLDVSVAQHWPVRASAPRRGFPPCRPAFGLGSRYMPAY